MGGIETLKKLRAKEEDFTLPTGDVIKLKGFTMAEMTDISMKIDKMKGNTEIDPMEIQEEFLFLALRRAFPIEGDDGISDMVLRDECKQIGGEVATQIVIKVRELSGLKTSDTPFQNLKPAESIKQEKTLPDLVGQ